jgi:cytochrome c553/mono/diheme cytochrome c family protein
MRPLYIVFSIVALAASIGARQTAGSAQTAAGQKSEMAPAATPEFFESRVRPLLATSCFECHTDKAEGGLRVDSREALLKGGDTGPALVPGDPDKSLIIQAVKRLPGAPQMPNGRAKLKPEDIDVLVDWVKAGAPWPAGSNKPSVPTGMVVTDEHRKFWSFQPLKAPTPPAVKDASWPKSDIDRFILARLEREGLKPNPAADKLTLIRRATLDLTGLPPSPEEVEAFVADKSPTAFAKVVDRLLASPRYGEAWGRIWLDVARYSEDDYRSLGPASYFNAYLYRDWVINAFNDDLPWDQFVRAQLAADLGDEGTRVRNLPALGFLGLGPWFYDNGSVEITRADERHDRVDAVSRGFLGLTVACARCHDHKYDPIPTRDYYALAGVFLNTQYTEYPLAPKAVVDEYRELEKKIEKKEQLLSEYMNNESKQLAGTLAFQVSKYMQSAWKVLGETKTDKIRVVESDKLDYELFDRWLRFLQKPPVFYPDLKPWQEMIKGGGTAAAAKRLGDQFQEQLIDLMIAKKLIDEENDIIRAKALPGTKKKEPSKLPNEFVTNDDFCPGCGLSLKSLPTEKMNLWADVFQRDFDSQIVAGQESTQPALLLFRGWGLERQLGPDRRALIEALRADIAAMRKTLPEKYAYVHAVKDVEKPVDLNIALRGNPFRAGDVVPRGFPTVLSPGEPIHFSKGSGRLELADTIVRQPIAIRVIVNRIWKGHMGSGIVDTPSNFGANGERPMHPELLDFLAQRFVDRKYSIKAMHREIMLSAAYQLSSEVSPLAKAHVEKDPANRLYWRGNSSRMSAEQIRDAVLFVSGALNTKMGGPSIALTPQADRRTVYGRVSRVKLDEFLQLFDFPSASQSAEKRFSTNVPLQRLFFMNSDFMQQHAEKLAARVIALPTDQARIQKTYRLIFGRAPTPAELAAGIAFLAAEPMKQYDDQKAAKAKAEAEAAAGKKPDTPAPDAPPMPPVGMMAGVVPGPGGDQPGKEPLPVTVFGRYVKVLLSSNEFLFVR